MTGLSNYDEDLKRKIAQRIRQLREQTGLSQSEFARENLIDRQTLNRWETGRGVTIYTISKFCSLVKMELKDFFDNAMFI